MGTMLETLERFAGAQAPVRIRGETGTGKELVARALHERSKRRGRLVVVHCAGVSEAQLEDELFGNVRGVLAGSRVRRHGLLQEAAGGTLVLDEVGELPPSLQTKLLRVIAEGRVRALGTDSPVAFDARLVSIARDDLETRLASGTFRPDLYYRLNVLQLDLAPLRARGADVLLLAAHFLAHAARRSGRPAARIAPEAARKLLGYGWPGNVRELFNVLERAVALTDHEEIHTSHLPDNIRGAQRGDVRRDVSTERALLTLEELSRSHILHVMASVGGSRNRAAVVLNVDRKTLYNKLKSYGWGRDD
jgi:DNA-binding NtrC family response regulator